MPQRRLLSVELAALTIISFFAFCNMAVFYSFFNYLERIGIPVEWRGILLGLEPMAAFSLRLAVIPMLHLGNASRMMLLSLVMLVAALASYGWATTIPTLMLLRVFHGAAFVLLVSSSMSLLVHYIPKEKSAQGFGFVSVFVLVPYAVMPLVTEALLPLVGSEAVIYRGVTVLAAPAFFVLLLLRKRMQRGLAGVDAALARRPTLEEMRRNLKESPVVLLLAVNLLLYLCYATVFFFMKDHCLRRGVQDVGSFFTTATLVMIALRLGAGFLLDRLPKVKVLAAFVLLLIPCFVLFGGIDSVCMLNLMALYYGLCIGVIFPLLNAALFVVSPPHLRGLNTNLSLFMMDAGFFLSPYAGGIFLATGRPAGSLFTACAGLLLLSLILLLVVGTTREAPAPKPAAEIHS